MSPFCFLDEGKTDLITVLDTLSWGKELVTGNAEFVETSGNILYIVSNVHNAGFGFGMGFGETFASPYTFVILKSDAVPPAPGPGATFGGVPPNSVPVATYVFPQPTISFDPVIAFDATTGLLHILGSRNTPISGSASSTQTNDLIKFTYDTVGEVLTGPFVVGASVGSRVRGAYDIGLLDTGNTMVAASFTDPSITSVPLVATITSVAASADIITFGIATMPTPFVTGQWVLIDGLTNATFLNGALMQVQLVEPTYFTASFQTSNYPQTSEPTGTASAVGSSLFAVELDGTTNQPVAGTATILASSPSRSGNTFDGLSLNINGTAVELYYQSHPKLITFQDQLFTINLVGRNLPPQTGFGLNFGNQFGNFGPMGSNPSGFGGNFGFDFGLNGTTWSPYPQVLFTFSARYTDSRLTVVQDQAGNRFMSLTYWSQLNHPEGIVGNVLMGVQSGLAAWFFHPTFGTVVGGSIIQSAISVARNDSVNLAYLLQPFQQVSDPPQKMTPAWPLQIATVDPATLALTNVPGFYNTVNLTWLRGTKSLVDNNSLWALVGEREVATTVTELHVVPSSSPYQVQIDNASSFFQDEGVVYFPSGIALVQVDTNPQQGQYTVEEGEGLYIFNILDAAATIDISYQYISQIVPVYASLFNVPPVAAIAPTEALVWRNGTFYSTDFASITGYSITANTITVTVANDFTIGQQIALLGFDNPTDLFLNGIVLTVQTATSSKFTAAFDFANTPLGFGIDFGFDFGTIFGFVTDTGIAAALIPGQLHISAAGSTDADEDALEYVWTENEPNLTDVFLTPSGTTTSPTTTLSVLGAVGPQEVIFDVGVAVIDLFPDLTTQRHPALVLTHVQVASGVLTLTFTAPTGAIVPIAGEQIMTYTVVLGAPPAPTLSTVSGGALPVQGAPGYGFQFGAEFGIFQPLSVIVTYVNGLGETVGSVNSTISSIDAGKLLEVTSPVGAGAAGDADSFNVYVGAIGAETLQPNNAGAFAPTPLGTNWIEPTTGFTNISTAPPTTSGAVQEFLSDQVLTLTAATATTLTATIDLGFGASFGFDFGTASFPLTMVTGFAISQFQFATTSIIVPLNVAPIATFPAPEWSALNVLNTTVARNTTITITPDTITDPTTQFPVIYTGLTDPDDSPTYLWAQVSGTTVKLPRGATSPTLLIDTNGVNLNGETLVFTLTLNDNINPAATFTFSIPVAAYVFNAANKDTLQLSRSVYSTSGSVTNVVINSSGFGTITANNTFVAGQSVWFEGLANATFLNNGVYTVLPTGFGTSFGASFGVASLSGTQFQIYNPNFLLYGPMSDTGTAYSSRPISQRNANGASSSWSPLDISILFNNLTSIKRTSVLDGSDRYILISPYSVLVYGTFQSATPAAVLLSRIFLPNNTKRILDAVHTEQGYTLVLDNEGSIYRYFQGSFIATDNPDVTIPISNFTTLNFDDIDLANDVHILTTVSFGNQRVLVLSGEEGALLLQVNTTTLQVTSTFELTVESNFVFGADKVQFVRWVDMDSTTTGRILIGTILNNQAPITNVAIADNTVTITTNNSFSTGDQIVLSSLTTATFLNGLTVKAIAVTPTTFEASLQVADYATAADTGLAQAQTSGNTYETLIDLSQQQIIGTFDKSKLRNQFVQTGEIMFDPDDTYSGGPAAPTLNPITTTTLGGNTNIVLSWGMIRPDLITSYTVEIALTVQVPTTIPQVAPFQFTVPANFEFTGDVAVFDGTRNSMLQATNQPSPLTGQYNATSAGVYTFSPFNAGDNVALTVRQAFNTFQVVNEGSVQSILASLPPAATYFFRVQATGLDGTSGFSNIQSITL